MINTVYVAAPWVEKDLMPDIAEKVEDSGLEITHYWWDHEDIAEEDRLTDELCEQAELDMNGVKEADAVILINSAKSEGKAVEQGLALAYGKPIFAVGRLGEHSKNVFHYLPNYYWYDTLDDVLEALRHARRS